MADRARVGGGEDDLCRLLIQRKLVPLGDLEKIVRSRRELLATGAKLEPLVDELVAKGLLASILEGEALKAETQALATCEGCGLFHVVDYFHAHRKYSCARCRLPLRPRPTATTIAGPPVPPASDAQESLMGSPLAPDSTILDMGAARTGKAPEEQPQESLMGAPLAADSTILDMGPAAKKPSPPSPSPQESLMGQIPLSTDSTLLDMGSVKKAPEPAEPHPLLAPEPTIMMGGPPPQSPASGTTGSTQVDPTIVMGETPKTQNRDASSSTSASRSSLNDGATPRTSTSTSAPGRAYAPLKSAPKEVVEAAKDAQRIFGKYILLKELGRGGAGVVYKAWDTTLAQFVALKFLRDQEGGDSETDTGSQAVADFQREARMSAKLRHPNIIRIYEMGSMSGRYYLSMDYIEGGSLLEYIHGGKERNSDTHFNSDVKRYLGIMIKIVEAVHAAHSNNPPVVHRDLKPHNVLVDKQHNPYVVDFGLAKEVELSTSQNTVTGAVKGTPSYMAPEQAEGRNKDVDARTDVYCLGAILYEMLTGRPPFVGGNVRIVLNAIVTQLPDRPNLAIQTALLEKSDGEHRPKPVDRPLETICMKALEKAKADRYQTAQELADDLKRYLNDEDIQAQEPGLWRRFRRQIRQHPLISGSVAASILCAGVIGGALYYTSKVDTGLGKIEAIAREHLAAKDWAAMKNDADSLRRVKPRHPLIAELESAVAAHETDLKNRRDVWDAGLKKLASDGPAALDSLRPPYRASGELRQEFSDRLQRALVELQSAGENEARELIGGGADERWLKADVKKAARNCRDRLAYLAGLSKDADFPFKASAQGSALRESLGKLLAYEGLFTLRVNVAPFARVVVKREGKVLAEEWTPLGVRNLEVAGAYELDLVAPGGKPLQIPLTDLKHGAVVVVSGDIGRRDVKAATQ